MVVIHLISLAYTAASKSVIVKKNHYIKFQTGSENVAR